MRNWPYAWALANAGDSPVKAKVGVAALPAGEDGRPAATLGGHQLAVSRYSAHPEAAAALVRYLTSYDEQKRHATAGSFHPHQPRHPDDAHLRAANPFSTLFLYPPPLATRP